MNFECELCGKSEDEDIGSWNQNPYIFFCGIHCHTFYIIKKVSNQIIELLDDLTSEERMKIFSKVQEEYCIYCGNVKPCRCWDNK
uniref:Uncharacterized protein n=1 Tax=viral metagenome TaxID=1070528 RepID=A0A6M3LF33_9ZZZZ